MLRLDGFGCSVIVPYSLWSLRVGRFALVASRWSLRFGRFALVASLWSLRFGRFALVASLITRGSAPVACMDGHSGWDDPSALQVCSGPAHI